MLFLLISLSCLLCAYVLLLFMFCDYAGLLAFLAFRVVTTS